MEYFSEQALSGTELTCTTLNDLNDWIVWQFPVLNQGYFSGAVLDTKKPNCWYPALIHKDNGGVKIYGHVETIFESPEVAAEFITNYSHMVTYGA